jgi:hypothetical protein
MRISATQGRSDSGDNQAVVYWLEEIRRTFAQTTPFFDRRSSRSNDGGLVLDITFPTGLLSAQPVETKDLTGRG